MHVSYDTNPTSREQLCGVLEALAEGFVEAMVAEIDADPDGFACCVKCSGFSLEHDPRWPARNAPLTDAQRDALRSTLEHGHPTSHDERQALGTILTDHHVRNPPRPNRHGRHYFATAPFWPGQELGHPGGEEVVEAVVTATESVRNPTPLQRPLQSLRARCAAALRQRGRGSSLDLAVFQAAQERRREKECWIAILIDGQENIVPALVYPDGTIKDPREAAASSEPCGCGNSHG